MLTTKFQQFPLPPDMLVNLEHLGFLEPTPVQAAVLPVALEGKDILATAQTGTGKTAAFGIPLLAKIYLEPGHQAVILAPTRELGAQIFKVLRQLSHKMNIAGSLVVGGESFNRQADELMRGVDFVVATPGRLNDHIQEGTIDLSGVTFLVLDEVDRMLDMGFLPQIKEVIQKIPVKRQTLLFSATLPKNMMGLAANLQTNAERIEIGHHSKPAEHVEQTTIETTMEGKNALVLKELSLREGKVLIFTRTKARTERLARYLSREGQTCVALHGDKHQSQRKMAMEAFRKGKARILVATDIAGRGIDVSDIAHVINYDLPMTREDYIHRIGRTGRIGKVGQAVTFLSPHDRDGMRIVTGVDPRKAAKGGGQGHKPQGQRPQHSRPRHGKPSYHAKPRHEGPRHDRPRHDRPHHDRPHHAKPRFEKPRPEQAFSEAGPQDNQRPAAGEGKHGKFSKFSHGPKRNFGGGGKRPFGNGDRKPFGGGEKRFFGGGDRRPFGGGERRPFGGGGRKPFGGGGKPFHRGPKPQSWPQEFDAPSFEEPIMGVVGPRPKFNGPKKPFHARKKAGPQSGGFKNWKGDRPQRPGGPFKPKAKRFGAPRHKGPEGNSGQARVR